MHAPQKVRAQETPLHLPHRNEPGFSFIAEHLLLLYPRLPFKRDSGGHRRIILLFKIPDSSPKYFLEVVAIWVAHSEQLAIFLSLNLPLTF